MTIPSSLRAYTIRNSGILPFDGSVMAVNPMVAQGIQYNSSRWGRFITDSNGSTPVYTNDTKLIDTCPTIDDSIERVIYVCYAGVITVLIAFGIFGNFFNFLIFSELTVKGNLGIYYLKVASILDLIISFLLIKFPVVYLARKFNWPMYYAYGHVHFRADSYLIIINTFMKTSSLLVTVISLERYLFLFHISAYRLLFRKRTYKWVPVLCMVLCLGLTIPYRVWNKVIRCFEGKNHHLAYVRTVLIRNESMFLFYQLTREIILSVIPTITILYTNYKLLGAFRKYYFSRLYSSNMTMFDADHPDNRRGMILTDRSRGPEPEAGRNTGYGGPTRAVHENRAAHNAVGVDKPIPYAAVPSVKKMTLSVSEAVAAPTISINDGDKLSIHSNNTIGSHVIFPPSRRGSPESSVTKSIKHQDQLRNGTGADDETKSVITLLQFRPGRRILMLLFASVISFLLFVTPITILVIFFPVWQRHCVAGPCLYKRFNIVFNTLEVCHYTLNFYLFLVADPKFREIFKDLISCNYWDIEMIAM